MKRSPGRSPERSGRDGLGRRDRHLAGHSLGTAVAAAVATERPEGTAHQAELNTWVDITAPTVPPHHQRELADAIDGAGRVVLDGRCP
ncbi:hypothetical protein ACWGH5_14110 [Streptomyces sp. NPDC054864]